MTLLDLVKMDLRIEPDDTGHDALLAVLLAEAKADALEFLDREELPDGPVDGLAAHVAGGIRVLVRMKFDGVTADEQAALRKIAEAQLFPARRNLGV